MLGPQPEGPSGPVLSVLLAPDGALYAGGVFTRAGGIQVNRIARWHAGSWHPLAAPGGVGVGNAVQALCWCDGALYLGGGFGSAGGVAVRGIARWDGLAFHPLAGGDGFGVDSGVAALLCTPDGVVAGGEFTQAGGGRQHASRASTGANGSRSQGLPAKA